jgi:hypothetical protein
MDRYRFTIQQPLPEPQLSILEKIVGIAIKGPKCLKDEFIRPQGTHSGIHRQSNGINSEILEHLSDIFDLIFSKVRLHDWLGWEQMIFPLSFRRETLTCSNSSSIGVYWISPPMCRIEYPGLDIGLGKPGTRIIGYPFARVESFYEQWMV